MKSKDSLVYFQPNISKNYSKLVKLYIYNNFLYYDYYYYYYLEKKGKQKELVNQFSFFLEVLTALESGLGKGSSTRVPRRCC